jgi:hypothetical protein
MRSKTIFAAFCLTGILVGSRNVSAQNSAGPAKTSVGAYAGLFQFDSHGTGTGGIAGLRAAHALVGNWLLAEGAVAYGTMREGYGATDTQFGIAEAQLQLQAPFHSLQPYIGAGPGTIRSLGTVSKFRSGTLSAATGLRLPTGNRTVLQAELRLREWNDWHAGAASWILGFSRAF